jgi:hypothetical protein
MTPSQAEIEAAAKAIAGGFTPNTADLAQAEAALTAAERVRMVDEANAGNTAKAAVAAARIREARTQGWKAKADHFRKTGEVTSMTVEARTQPCPNCAGNRTKGSCCSRCRPDQFVDYEPETGQPIPDQRGSDFPMSVERGCGATGKGGTHDASGQPAHKTSDKGAGSGNAPDRSGESDGVLVAGLSAASDPPAENSTPLSEHSKPPNGDISGENATSLPPSNRTVTPIPDEAIDIGLKWEWARQAITSALPHIEPAIRADTLAKVRDLFIGAAGAGKYDSGDEAAGARKVLWLALMAMDEWADDDS